MKFYHPEALYLLFLIPLLSVITLFRYYRTIRDFRSLVGKTQKKWSLARLKILKLLSFLSLIISLVSLIIALADPLWGRHISFYNRQNELNIIFALDISRSMEAKDIVPNRLEKMKETVLSLSRQLPSSRMGVIGFKGDPVNLLPLTYDRLQLNKLMEVLNPEMLTSKGSNIEKALNKAINLFPKPINSHDVIILISDGGEQKKAMTTVDLLSKSFLGTLFVVGAGTKEGSRIEEKDGSYIKDHYGNIVVSKLNTKLLKWLVYKSHGFYYKLDSPFLVRDIIKSISFVNNGEGGYFPQGLKWQYPFFIGISFLFFVIFMLLQRLPFQVNIRKKEK